MKGKLFTEGELRKLPNGTQVHIVYTSPSVEGQDYDGLASVKQVDEAVVFELGFTTLVYELTGDDTVSASSFSGTGDTIEVYHV